VEVCPVRKLATSAILMLAGTAIFVMGSPYYAVFPTNRNPTYYAVLTVALLVVSLALRRSRKLSHYAPPATSLFIASAALLFLSTGVLELRRGEMDLLEDLALDKASQFLHVVPVLIALSLIAGRRWRYLFIARGDLRRGLLFGSISFVTFAAIAYLVQSGSQDFPRLTARSIGLVLAWVFLNATMEELWFRGLFLKPYRAVAGRTGAMLVTSLVFGVQHVFATYDFPGGPIVFGIVVFSLGLVSAYAMDRTESLIGPILFHAGYDLIILAPVLASM
jgi:membrane protease YdiL (CAAX protease family)